MSFFSSLLQTKKIIKHDGRPLWKYMLTNEEYSKLKEELQFSNSYSIDPRDVTLYFSEWWKKNYQGGTPSKQDIFESLKWNFKYNFSKEEFYKLAKKGARMLGIKWISKQNTLYFRTLLLQGGLPLSHIAENQGNYQSFLLAVLEEQPDTIEDFIFNPIITSLLPIASRNEIIYENCFEIVKSILNNENVYDDLLGSNEALVSITKSLKKRQQQLERKQRISKPKNYWILSFKKEKIVITLRIGLAETYTLESLSNILGFEVTGKEYQLYVNDELICIFRKMINGSFKTDWYNQKNQEWDGVNILPFTYVIKDGEKHEVTDFIETVPSFNEPSLWSKFSDNEWRLIKGNGTSNKEAAVILPLGWISTTSSIIYDLIGEKISWLTFEGEVEISNQEQVVKYLSDVNSFEWTIISHKPKWMHKASMPVVLQKPSIIIYDKNGVKLPETKFQIWIKKHKSFETWKEISLVKDLPLGCIDIKIEANDIVAYDMFFNLGNFKLDYTDQTIDKAKLIVRNLDTFEFKLDESKILEIQQQNHIYYLNIDTTSFKIPTSIKGLIGHHTIKKLSFEMVSPFQGMVIIDGNGKIISENEKLTLTNLYGLRILSKPNSKTILRIKNRLNPEVSITKEIKEPTQPLISFLDEITRLYYLADSLNHENKVSIELIEGSISKTYEISGFSHMVDIDEQYNYTVKLDTPAYDIDLYAIPLNCNSDSIDLIPLIKNDESYLIPNSGITNQYIIISAIDKGKQLMPRFVNTDVNYIGISKEERIENYHNEFLTSNLDAQIWKQLLVYFNICVKNDLPFSTFDQIRAISRSSKVASRAFLFLGINQEETNYYVQKAIPEMEKDLGFCFHWIKKEDWLSSLLETKSCYGEHIKDGIEGLIAMYMDEIGLGEICLLLSNIIIQNDKKILNSDIINVRALLGERVLKELPHLTPKITKEYSIPINQHLPVKLLLRGPIAVAESINDTQNSYPIWAGDDHREKIRRNIQYCQYLNPEFYIKVILHVLKN
jgi:hypothetical protein